MNVNKSAFLIILAIPLFCAGVFVLCSLGSIFKKECIGGTETFYIIGKLDSNMGNPATDYHILGDRRDFDVNQDFYKLSQIGDLIQVYTESGTTSHITLKLIHAHKEIAKESDYVRNVIGIVFLWFLLGLALILPLMGAIFIKNQNSYWWQKNFKVTVAIYVIGISFGIIVLCVQKLIK
jgi:hypothetical protein